MLIKHECSAGLLCDCLINIPQEQQHFLANVVDLRWLSRCLHCLNSLEWLDKYVKCGSGSVDT